jgi:hypothetical protein
MLTALVGAVLIIGGVVYLFSNSAVNSHTGVPEEAPGDARVAAPPAETEATSAQEVASYPAPGLSSRAQASASQVFADPQSRQLVSAVVDFGPQGADFTPAQAAQWHQALKNLVKYGPAAVPAIRDYLSRNADTSFGASGTNNIGYATARAAMFDALARIGGSEATDLLRQNLTSSANPSEIAWIAQGLMAMSGEHREETLEAVRSALGRAESGEISNADVAPLFEVLQRYGDASMVDDLVRMSRNWNYYAVAALAQLPEGVGMPTLVEIAAGQVSGAGEARGAAVQMLAQSALDSPVAKAGFLEQAREGKLTPYSWSLIAPMLAGDQLRFEAAAYSSPSQYANASDIRSTHVGAGNQNFYTAPVPELLSVNRLKQHAAFVDELLNVTTDPAGQEALQKARDMISRRLGDLSAGRR